MKGALGSDRAGARLVYEALSGTLRGTSFYLAGGTALALLDGHRVSVAPDFFAPAIGPPDDLARRIAAQGLDILVTSTAPETLHAQIGSIQVSFSGSPAPLSGPPVQPAPGACCPRRRRRTSRP